MTALTQIDTTMEIQEVETKEADINIFLDQCRKKFGLRPKGKYESNFIFKSQKLEYAHILRNELDDIFLELEQEELACVK